MTEPHPAANVAGSAGRQLFRLLQLLALAAVLGLLALLVWRFLAAHRGAELVNAIRAGERPAAPAFTAGRGLTSSRQLGIWSHRRSSSWAGGALA